MNTCTDTYINKYIHTYINTYINAYIKWHDMTLQFITWAYQTRQTDRQTHTHTHTHLLRNILSNYWCGMHRTCKKHSSKPDRRWWMTRREKQCRRILPLKLQQRSGQRVQQLKTICRYTTGRPQLLPLQWHSFVGQGSHWRPCPPAFVGKSNEKAKKAMSNWKTIEAHHQAS